MSIETRKDKKGLHFETPFSMEEPWPEITCSGAIWGMGKNSISIDQKQRGIKNFEYLGLLQPQKFSPENALLNGSFYQWRLHSLSGDKRRKKQFWCLKLKWVLWIRNWFILSTKKVSSMQMSKHLTAQKVWCEIQVMLYRSNAHLAPNGTEWQNSQPSLVLTKDLL